MMSSQTAPVQLYPPQPPVAYPPPGYLLSSPCPPIGYEHSPPHPNLFSPPNGYPRPPLSGISPMAGPPLPVSAPQMNYYAQAPPVIPPEKAQTSSRQVKNQGCLAGCLAALCCCFVLEECCCCGPTVIVES